MEYGNVKIELPASAAKVIAEIEKAGFEAYVVGGCVRDSILGKKPDDWDITTSAKPQDIKKIFRSTVDTGIKHGTVTVLMRENGKLNGYEVTTYRIDGDYADGRHPKEVQFTPELSEDLKRRDFTINAMAYHPERGLVDLFSGREDLEKKLIRCVGNPNERFSEDALRMMRAIRFAAVLGGTVEEKTLEAVKAHAADLSKISAERIRTEAEKLLVSDNPYYFKLFYETGLTKVFLPEFDKCMETTQENPHHCYDVGEHLLHSTENINTEKLKEELGEEAYKDNLRLLRITMILHDIGKPGCKTIDENGIAHFKGHPALGAKMAEDILKRLKFDNDTIAMAKGLIQFHEGRYAAEKKLLRRAINSAGEKFFPLMFYVYEADTLAQSMFMREEKTERLKELRKLYAEIKASADALSLKDLAVKGGDLIACGVRPGKDMGELLNAMLSDVIDEPSHNDKEYLLEKYVTKK